MKDDDFFNLPLKILNAGLLIDWAITLFSECLAHENHPRVNLILSNVLTPKTIWQTWHNPGSGSVTRGHRENGTKSMCTSFGEEWKCRPSTLWKWSMVLHTKRKVFTRVVESDLSVIVRVTGALNLWGGSAKPPGKFFSAKTWKLIKKSRIFRILDH